MSGLFGSTTIPGNRITDFADQTATVGTPITFGYGTFPVTKCNVIWIGDVVEHVTKKKQGKGGVKTEEYTYTRSYAIGVCQGPIYGYLIIRRNGKVVYTEDPNAPVEDKDYAAKWLQSATLYLGTRTQLPDSTIEAKEGAGQVSAFRDLAYIVVEDDDVTDGAGAVPSYEAVVVASPPEVYMTSRPYAIEAEDEISPSTVVVKVRPQPQPSVSGDYVAGTLSLLSVDVYGGAQAYSFVEADQISPSISLLSVDVYGGAKAYSYVEPDQIAPSIETIGVNIYGGAAAYTIPFEYLAPSATVQSVLLETV